MNKILVVILLIVVGVGAFWLGKNQDKIVSQSIISNSNENLLTVDQAEVLVKKSWPDFVSSVPECQEDSETCPHLQISVVNWKNYRTNIETTHTILADIVGFSDDSYTGERRQALVFKDGNEWVLYDYSEFTLCRAFLPYPKGAICP